jgi:hypothetical protein
MLRMDVGRVFQCDFHSVISVLALLKIAVESCGEFFKHGAPFACGR